MNRMKKSCIAVIILMLLLLPICTIAHGYNYDLTEIPKEEANGILSQFHFKSVSQDEVGGYINNFDIDPKTGEICVSFDSNDGHDRAQWACVYDTDGAFRYGVYTDWYRKINCTWIDGYMYLFPDVSNYTIKVYDSRIETSLYETRFDSFNSKGTKQIVNGCTYELKKKNEVSRDEYTSLERIDEDGECSTLVSCTWISDDIVLHSKVRSIFERIVQIGIPVFFVSGITVWIILWKKKLRYKIFGRRQSDDV